MDLGKLTFRFGQVVFFLHFLLVTGEWLGLWKHATNVDYRFHLIEGYGLSACIMIAGIGINYFEKQKQG